MFRSKRQITGMIMAFLLVVFFMSCQKKDSDEQIPTEGKNTEIKNDEKSIKADDAKTSPTAEKAKPAQASSPAKVAGIVFQADQFMRLVQMGMKSEADAAKAELKEGNSLNQLSSEISLVDTYAAEGVQAILITPLSKTGSVEALKRASEKGIKIITFNTDIEADFQSTFLESDQNELGSQTGKLAGEFIKTKLNGKAKIAMLEFMSLSPEQSKGRVDGFKAGLKSVEGITFEIVSEQDAWLAPQAATMVENMLTANPDINLIWAANEGGTVGAVTAVGNKGKSGKVFVFGTDMSEQLAGFLTAEDNILQAVTGQQPYIMGQQAMTSALKILGGEKLDKRIIVPSLSYSRGKTDDINTYLKSMEKFK